MVNEKSISLKNRHVVLLLQGGGALGAYQVGAFEALHELCRREKTSVDWVGGISIGAVNAAVIAAPKCKDPLKELEMLWGDLLKRRLPLDWQQMWAGLPPLIKKGFGWLGELGPKYLDWTWTAFNPLGQMNFFTSRVLNPLENPWTAQWFSPEAPQDLAFCDTRPLRQTLDKHVDWAAMNRPGATRLSLGASRVRDGEVVFFNSFKSDNPDWGPKTITVDHVMASGALPPGFPAIQVEGEWYWDGGLSTNTPIEALEPDLTADDSKDTLVFLVDLWDRKGAIPRSLDEVIWRQKSIQYGSRRDAAAAVVDRHELKVAARRVPERSLEVCQVMLERPADDPHPQFSLADADFARTEFDELKGLGYRDMRKAILQATPVPGVGGEFAKLYRLGTFGKHAATDAKYAAARSREEQRRRAWKRRPAA
ncbi:MAG TPA: patatin-like phospholipase family protein [Terriglobia bacterium]|nr:patatin-like phospholipase family protein [Terriglobia bacterium]